jgi:hypothetical protein
MQAPLLTRRATLATLWGGAVVGWGVACDGALGADIVISPKGLALERFLDGLDVDRRWIAGVHIDWETGIPDGKPEKLPGKHTHCSAFVASAAKKLGIYILRPPEHGQVLLANAQFEWLEGEQGASMDGDRLPMALRSRPRQMKGTSPLQPITTSTTTSRGTLPSFDLERRRLKPSRPKVRT